MDDRQRMRLSGQPNDVVSRVFDFIDARYADAISLTDVAKALHYSPTYLTSLVRRRTGRPITAWIIQRRVDAACERLQRTNETIAIVAEAAGFPDPGYFRRCFVRAIGMNPARWRSQMQLRNIVPVAGDLRLVR